MLKPIWCPLAATASPSTPWWKPSPLDPSPIAPWEVNNNPKTAIHEWLKTHPEFEIDKDIDNKLLISVAPDGYLKRVG